MSALLPLTNDKFSDCFVSNLALKQTSISVCRIALISLNVTPLNALTQDRLHFSKLTLSCPNIGPISNSFCGYSSCMFFDNENSKDGNSDCLKISCSSLFELFTVKKLGLFRFIFL